jgi:hypothetical protein
MTGILVKRRYSQLFYKILYFWLTTYFLTLVSLTLMIAESHTDEMDTMVKVVVSLINRKN